MSDLATPLFIKILLSPAKKGRFRKPVDDLGVLLSAHRARVDKRFAV
jgi:hypothetical protein